MKSSYVPIFLIATLFFSVHSATAQTGNEEPAELAALRARYDTDLTAAIQPVQGRYKLGLQNQLKTFTLRGDLPSANAVQAELDRLTNASGKPMPPAPSAETGKKEPAELKALRARYDTDIATAVQPVQSRYKLGLQNQLKTFIQRSDLQSANAVQAELDKLTNALGKPIPVGWPQSRLVETSWLNPVPGGSRLEFLPSGQFREVYPVHTWTGTWKAISATEADAVVGGVDGTFHYKLNSDGKTVSRPDTKFIWKLMK